MNFEFKGVDYPTSPGVYSMKDSAGRIIYVGKAASLRTRLSSYFRQIHKHSPKTRILVSKINSIDTLVTATEKEALLLEASLIKKHRPRYNIVLKDDKQYVLFQLDKRSEYPRLRLTRKVVRDGSVYFGPYTSSFFARETWKILGKVFPLRKCSDTAFKNRVRPCLYHDMGQCLGPCVNFVPRQDYMNLVRQVEMLLSGKAGDLISSLRLQMESASESLEFEKAAKFRDQIKAINKTVEKQSVVLNEYSDIDVIALAESSQGVGLGLLFVRKGRLLDKKNFFWPGLSLEEGEEILHSFVSQFYSSTKFIPPKLLVPFEFDMQSSAEILSERSRNAVRITTPHTGEEKRLLEIARKNASIGAREKKNDNILEVLASRLKLSSPPQRIECIDASHLGGEGMRVGMVVYEDAKPEKSQYRTYVFPELEYSSDDYAALYHWVIKRIDSGPPWGDLILIDGGKGQLAAVEKAFSDNWTDEAPIPHLASIAKGPTRKAGELEDRIFRPGRKNHLPLKGGSPELLYLQRIRDEAHRFVIGRQRKSRKKKVLQSEVLSLPGIGPKTARLLWDAFESVAKMKEATVAELSQVPGIGKKRAKQIYDAFIEL
ncbi:excinuclease ABC subunit UvrC [Maridesulfovibrio hydrothermalis]|uniref:UvrABC system protein C n=1 Tax=Maridesulfovibrio hydrothermalis AM13 = DSM 14728 TaxID=1121451 RepID=L0RCM4_9BACT|nr:excinuclease ABC subunit UvrC [Maridesulfovibrio hydrothermalis]CCO24499.1 UvrABC system protein C [Maridesulfovibrio hydrothermalis AM13 = DSM 14728]